jgi:hypothetical protein
MSQKLSEAEHNGLAMLIQNGGSILVSRISETNSKGLYGEIEPGMPVFRRMAKKGWCFETEEDPTEMKDGDGNTFIFEFTPSIEITPEGEEAFRSS